MIYSQAPLLKLLGAGKIPGESGIPEHIETILSNVFLFKERTYKLYKNDNEFVNKNFGDLSLKEKRFEFSNIDFGWNHQLAKEVYLRIQGVNIGADNVRFVDKSEDAEELLLVTKRLPRQTSLFEHLRNNDLVEADYYEIGKQFAKCEKRFISNEELPKASRLENMMERNLSIVDWVRGVEKYVPIKERTAYTDQLTDLIKNIYTDDSAQLAIAFDVHCLNAFYIDGVFYPFDVVAVNDAWHFAPALVNIYRLAADVFALVGEKEFRAVLQGYYDHLHLNPPSKETEQLLVIYSSLIMVPYLYMLGETDTDKHEAAIKYHDFLKRYTSRTLNL